MYTIKSKHTKLINGSMYLESQQWKHIKNYLPTLANVSM